jgi:glycosyltransferase involved in cell wall biosynthesis
MKSRDESRPGIDPSRRRLLYLQPCSSFGGAERQASLNVPGLAKAGFDVLPLVGPSTTIVRWLNDSGVTDLVHTRAFPGDGAPLRGWARAQLPFIYLRCLNQIARQIEELVRSRQVDAIFAAMPFSWIAATPVARRLGIPVIWRAGGTEIRPFEQAMLAAWAAFHPPDLLVCCGQAVHDHFAHLVPAPAAVVNNGVDTETFRPGAGDRQRYRPDGAKLVIGFAARLCPQKRPEDFLRMAAEIAPYHPDVTFLIAGDGSRLPEYQAFAERSPAAGQVRFLGYVDDIRSFYAACDIFVLPSRSEGCPNVVLESMAMRRALVVSNAAGTREVVAHEREALVYPIGDVAALSDAVRKLIEQPELRRELEARAYQRVETAFSTRASARELADLLHIVVDRARQPQPEMEVEAAGSLIRYPPVALERSRPWWVPSRFASSRFAGGGRP